MKRLISFVIRYIPRPYLQRAATFSLKVLGLFYRGSAVECPVCQHTFRKFLPYGRLRARPNALCPNCQALERHRLIWQYLKEKTGFFRQPLQVLHIAPEACFIPRFEKVHGKGYITADIESPLAKVKMDIHQIPFSENTFDVVLCNHVLEHVQDDIQAMREIHRVLKPKGFAILQVPFFSPMANETFEDPSITDRRERERLFGQDDHVRKYGYDYPTRIASSGLKPIEDHFAETLPAADIERYGLVRQEVLYVGVKE